MYINVKTFAQNEFYTYKRFLILRFVEMVVFHLIVVKLTARRDNNMLQIFSGITFK